MTFCQIEWKINSLLRHQASVHSANTPLMPVVMDTEKHKLQQGEKTYILAFHNLLGGILLQTEGENSINL